LPRVPRFTGQIVLDVIADLASERQLLLGIQLVDELGIIRITHGVPLPSDVLA